MTHQLLVAILCHLPKEGRKGTGVLVQVRKERKKEGRKKKWLFLSFFFFIFFVISTRHSSKLIGCFFFVYSFLISPWINMLWYSLEAHNMFSWKNKKKKFSWYLLLSTAMTMDAYVKQRCLPPPHTPHHPDQNGLSLTHFLLALLYKCPLKPT